MTNEPVLWRGGTVARRHERDLIAVHYSGELAEVEETRIGRVTQRAIFEALQVNMARAQAERLAPDGAEHYALLATAGVVEMAKAIGHVSSGR